MDPPIDLSSSHFPSKGTPIVSVLISTYNHERYVAQALESVLMQTVNFPVELLVIDDHSTDATPQILRIFEERHPGKVRVLLGSKNQRNNRRLAEAFRDSSAKYVCLIDGDDYWTRTDKLQRQVEFLDSHPQCSMAFHNALVVHEDGSRPPFKITPPGYPELSTLDDILGTGSIASCSVMIRRDIFRSFPDWFIQTEVADWAINVLAAQHGAIGYIDEVMGVYRRHQQGMWSQLSYVRQLEKRVRFYDQLKPHLGFAHEARLAEVFEKTSVELRDQIGRHVRRREWSQAFLATTILFRYYPLDCLRECVTELRPSYRPRPLRRYPAPYRLFRLIRRFFGGSGAVPPLYNGHHDGADGIAIAGWIWDSARPGTSVTVEISDGSSAFVTVVADRFRKDLLEAGIGNGYHAFVYWIPDRPDDGRSHSIHVTAAGQGWSLPGTPITFKGPDTSFSPDHQTRES